MATDTAATVVELDALLVSGSGAAKLCGLSPRTWRRLDSAGAVPLAIRIGGGTLKRYLASELRSWAEAGCPNRQVWEILKQTTGAAA